MLRIAIRTWLYCVKNKKPAIITRETFKEYGIAEPTITDFMRYLRNNELGVPLHQDSKALKNYLKPNRSCLLDVRNYAHILAENLEKSERTASIAASDIAIFKELEESCDKLYSCSFGDPRE